MSQLVGAISSDIDTLSALYKGRGLRRSQYSHAEFEMGLEGFARFLERFRIKATLFVVGQDLADPANASAARAMFTAGHEIANHTYTHAQGFGHLDEAEMERELAQMEHACEAACGCRPTGFRSPGWNVSDRAIAVLKRRGYRYDSSVHPTVMAPLFKTLHWWNTGSCAPGERTTLGSWRYMFAPTDPYRSSATRLGRRGVEGLVELPVSVVPIVRMPFWATFLLASGFEVFKQSLRLMVALGRPMQYQFHLTDFIDPGHPALSGQIPQRGDGVYVAHALRMPLRDKLALFERALDLMAEHYTFITLDEWAKRVPA